jgi:hypothetical protein
MTAHSADPKDILIWQSLGFSPNAQRAFARMSVDASLSAAFMSILKQTGNDDRYTEIGVSYRLERLDKRLAIIKNTVDDRGVLCAGDNRLF